MKLELGCVSCGKVGSLEQELTVTVEATRKGRVFTEDGELSIKHDSIDTDFGFADDADVTAEGDITCRASRPS